MNDIQFEAFSLYAGMRMDGMSKLDAFCILYGACFRRRSTQTDTMIVQSNYILGYGRR